MVTDVGEVKFLSVDFNYQAQSFTLFNPQNHRTISKWIKGLRSIMYFQDILDTTMGIVNNYTPYVMIGV